jgi:hypothetical protein
VLNLVPLFALLPDWLDPEKIISRGGYLLIFAIIFAESGLLIGFFLPGDSLLFTAGMFAAGTFEAKLPNAWFISAHDPKDVAEVRKRIIAFFEDAYEEAELVVPYDRQRLVSEMHEVGKVCEERYEEAGVIVRFRGEPETIARLRSRLA